MGIEHTTWAVLKPRHKQVDHPCKVIHHRYLIPYSSTVNQKSALSLSNLGSEDKQNFTGKGSWTPDLSRVKAASQPQLDHPCAENRIINIHTQTLYLLHSIKGEGCLPR